MHPMDANIIPENESQEEEVLSFQGISSCSNRTVGPSKVESTEPGRLGFMKWCLLWTWRYPNFEPRKYPANTPNTSLGSWQNYIYTEWKDEIWLQFHVVATNIYSTSNDSSPHVPIIIALERHDTIYMIWEDFYPFHFATFCGTSPCSPSLIFPSISNPFRRATLLAWRLKL